jgi:hypothetical protein
MSDTEKSIHEAAVVREFVKHPGFSILKREVEQKISDSRYAWLQADKDKAEEIRIQAKAWGDIFDLLKRIILKGDAAGLKQDKLKGNIND